MLGFAVVGWVLRWRAGERRRLPARDLPRSARTALLVCGIGFWVVPFVVEFVSTHGSSSLWLGRYMISCALGGAILAAELLGRALRLPRGYGLLRGLSLAARAAQAAAIVFFLWKPAKLLIDQAQAQPRELPPKDVEVRVADGGLVVEHIHTFLLLHFHGKHPERYAFVVDDEVGLKIGGGRLINHKIMAAFHRQFPREFPFVLTTSEYLGSRDEFDVLTDGQGWFQQRIKDNPAWQYRAEGALMHVTRKKATPR
jgi:hypothetical protein